MRVYLSNCGSISLMDAHNFRALDVLIEPQPEPQLAQALTRIGTRDGDSHVWLFPQVLRFLACQAADSEWDAGFAAMLAYAQQHGWVNDQGQVRAHITLAAEDQVVSVADFKAAMRALPAGISAVTTGQGKDVAGMIVSSLTSISAEPPMVGFFAHSASSMGDTLLQTGKFVANVLGEEHSQIIASFLSQPQGEARFKEGRWHSSEHQLPVLSDALASMECDIVCTHTLGTHKLVVGKIRKSSCNSASPVVNFNASTHKLVPLAA
ncbi:MAG: flavin reductase family protein [Comamonas sp.]|jgi:flavin reductase (DIM6/NTAB) family NADH-FMN oxidoreductase RutF|nr:flavin reductase family protein [Comamonas sp.]